MAKVKLLKNCFVDNKPRKTGEVVDTKRSSLLVGSGLAQLHVDVEPEKDEKPKAKAKESPKNRKAEVDETR